MIEQLQNAYDKALKNLVFVDFSNKKFDGGRRELELEIAKEKACCADLLKVIDLHFKSGDYELAKDRLVDLENSINYVEDLEKQLKEQRRNKLFDIASSLCSQGKTAKVVKFNVNPI